MKKTLAIGALCLVLGTPVSAATVFQSFPNYANAGDSVIDSCSSCTGAGAVFASFSLGSAETLDRASVLISSFTPAGALNSLTISIFSDGGNDLPATNLTGGIANPILFLTYTNPTSVTLDPSRTNGGLSNYVADFALPNWQLGPGKYWVRFAGASTLLPSYFTATPSHSRMVGTDFFLEGRSVTFNPSNYAIGFSFNGIEVTTGVPEPATWGMMILGFGMIGSIMRRKQATLVASATSATR